MLSFLPPFVALLSHLSPQQQRLNEEDEALVRDVYGGAEDGVYVKRLAEVEDEYGSDFESEDAMRSLLIVEVEGVRIFLSFSFSYYIPF